MINTRRATQKDVEDIYIIGENVDEFRVNETTVSFWPKDILKNALGSDDVFIWLAEENDVIVGFVIANYSKGLRKAIIENIYVIPDYRNMGIAKELLDAVTTILIEFHCQYIATLIPIDDPEALGLYTNSGFKKGESFIWLDKSLSRDFKAIS